MLAAALVTWQLADSAFPSGSYTLSHGLEGYAQAGAIDADALPDLLRDLLLHAIGPADATALALAHRGAREDDWEQVRQADERLHASKLTREPRQASLRIGRQLLSVCGEVFPSPRLRHLDELVAQRRTLGTQAVVTGVVYAGMGVPREQAVAADLFAFCTSFAGAALRLRLADHRSAQTLVRGAAAPIAQATRAALRAGLEDVGGCAPLADVMSANHELAEARLFAS
ncbi:MAG TPA: urease accessory UreF family protein [Conexibacter sp.]|jgi:urease accessory protein|nr:urease accessory UreF family protein [Conexibacter sp.]